MSPSAGILEGVSAALALFLVSAVVCNFLLLISFARVTTLRRSPTNYLWVLLAVSDLVASLLWLPFSLASAAQWDWAVTSGYCQFHGILSTFCFGVNMHTFVIIAVEKCLLLTKPSKHDELFSRFTVFILIGGVCIFDLVIALFPAMGWSKVAYSPYQFQCTQDYMKSESHVNFIFVVVWCVPVLVWFLFYMYAFCQVRAAKKRQGAGGKLVLEENLDVPWESYAIKLHRIERRIKKLNFDEKQPLLEIPDPEQDVGYASEESAEPLDDDDEEGITDYIAPRKHRVYVLKRSDMRMAMTMFVCSLLYSIAWLPTEIVSYLWSFYWQDPPSDSLVLASALLAVLGLFLKPLVYISNKDLRLALKEGLQRKEEFPEHRGRSSIKTTLDTAPGSTNDDNLKNVPGRTADGNVESS